MDIKYKIFTVKKIPKENTPCKCLSLIMLDSVIISNKNNYPQKLLEECKYEMKKKITKISNGKSY